MKFLIFPELNNKFLIDLKILQKNSLDLVQQFSYSEVNLIKKIIAMEILSGNRPIISVIIYEKKISVMLRTKLLISNLSYFQKSPINLNNFNKNLTEKLSVTAVQSNELSYVIINSQTTLLSIFIKSAYLD